MLNVLTQAQRAVVECSDNSIVLAGPGSGKTFTIVAKVARCVQHTSGKVVVVTFTRDAATELKTRLAEAMPDQVHRVRCGTFHSLALQQLKGAGGTEIRIARPVDEEQAARHVIKSHRECDMTAGTLISSLSLLQSLGMDEQLASELFPYLRTYRNYLKSAGVQTFADVIIEASVRMKAGTLAPYDATYLLIDETQDMDAMQLSWVLQHVSAGAKVTAVGDDDQSLYSWRGALGFSAFEALRQRCNAKVFVLNENFRSRPGIVDASLRLIDHGKQRFEKQVKPQQSGKSDLNAFVMADRAEEIDFVMLRAKVPRRVAVLARNNALLRSVAAQLKASKIEFVFGAKTKSKFDGPAGAFLEMIVSLERGTGAGVVSAINLLANEADFSDVAWPPLAKDVLRQLELQVRQNFPALFRDRRHRAFHLLQLVGLWTRWEMINRDHGSEKVIRTIQNWVASNFERNTQGDLNDQFRWKNFWLEKAASKLCKAKGSLAARVEKILDETKPDFDSAQLVLMTVHASKGLEFDEVILIAAEDGVLPSSRGEQDEERRIAYVAMTGAKQSFTACYLRDPGPSSFLYEAGLL